MNGHAKRAIKMLEALDFRIDDERSIKGERYYWHPNQPDQRLKVYAGLSEAASKAIQQKANKIADTGWSGPAIPTSVKERARIKKQDTKRREAAEREARRKRAEAAEERYQRNQRLRAADDRMREIQSLMQPGGRR